MKFLIPSSVEYFSPYFVIKYHSSTQLVRTKKLDAKDRISIKHFELSWRDNTQFEENHDLNVFDFLD